MQRNNSGAKALIALLALGLIAAAGEEPKAPSEGRSRESPRSHPPGAPKPHSHFTPEVEKFVEGFKPAGEGVDGPGENVAPSPQESLSYFRLPEGLEMDVVASEPVIRQPLNLHFDERGRLWVVQYIQYPFPAGLKVVKYDKYLRAVFDKVPSPPPGHVPGADRITILEDRDGDGRFDSHKDFLTGLNIATSVAVGRGGVWVLNPPYLLFYPDRNKDDVPDGAPEVRLSGFGLEDTHAVANNLHWGPDGWLYGVQGSTTTAHVKGIQFLGQAVWRYHPQTRAFELFAEGGGNPWTLEFDSKGRILVGTNNGGVRGLHFVQGGYYVKNWGKHGPLTNPYAFGFFQHMAHSGYQPRFSQTLVIYEGGALPGYEGQMIAGMALTNRVQASRILKDTSSFKTEDTDALVLTDNRWFRPVDMKVGPDGAVYIADWCDIRLSHLSPRDNWDKSNGRIYRLKSKGAQPAPPFDLSRLGSERLLPYLSHQNKWFREQVKRVLADRRDPAIVPALQRVVEENRGQLALEALWSVNLSGGWGDAFALRQLSHPDEHVRCWTVRLLGDGNQVTPPVQARLVELARTEAQAEVRSQLASSCKRLPAQNALPILRELLLRREDLRDLHIPLLLWWAIENKTQASLPRLLDFLKDPALWESPLFTEYVVPRLGRRFTAERGHRSYYTLAEGEYSAWLTDYSSERTRRNLQVCAQLLDLAPGTSGRLQIIRGMAEGLRGFVAEAAPASVQKQLSRVLEEQPVDAAAVSVALRLRMEKAIAPALRLVADPQRPETDRTLLIAALADRRIPSAVSVFLSQLETAASHSLRLELLANLRPFGDVEIARRVVKLYPGMAAEVRAGAQRVLSERAAWARILLEAVDSGAIRPDQISQGTLVAIRSHNDSHNDRLIQKHWANRRDEEGPGGELRSLVQNGEKLYLSKCSYCHLASGQGMKKPLVNSRWVLGTEGALVRILLQGKQGEGEMMPAFGAELDDRQIADLLTYLRRQWGHRAEAVMPATVQEVKCATVGREKPWTEAELQGFLK